MNSINKYNQLRAIRVRFLPVTNKLENRIALKDLKFGTSKIIDANGGTLETAIEYLEHQHFNIVGYSVNEVNQDYLILISWYPTDLPDWENKYINGKIF